MAQNSLYLAYQNVRFFKQIPFEFDVYPLSTISIPLDKVFFSYKNDDLRAKFSSNVNYLFYQIEVRDGDKSIGIHFELDFEKTIVEVTPNSVIVWARAPIYTTSNKSILNDLPNKFSEIATTFFTTTPGDKLTPIEDSGAAHTIKGGYGVNMFTPEKLLN